MNSTGRRGLGLGAGLSPGIKTDQILVRHGPGLMRTEAADFFVNWIGKIGVFWYHDFVQGLSFSVPEAPGGARVAIEY